MAKTSKKDRFPQQPPGMPRGKHLTGFKGMKTEENCNCGGCHPNAKAAQEKING